MDNVLTATREILAATTEMNAIARKMLESTQKRNSKDRSAETGNHMPSGVSIIMRDGQVAGLISAGGKMATPGDQENNKITGPTGGMLPYYWKEQ
jgi:hypothetical protein